MHPVLFRFSLPHFLHGILPGHLTVYTYGFMIALGIIAAYSFTVWQANKQLQIKQEVITNLTIILILAAFIGGKIFFFFEDPHYYFGHPANMLKSLNRGFVFYGSLIFAVLSFICFFKRNKIPVLKMLDIIAITTCIVHAFGRTGCFMAGCCHGKPTHSIFGVIFTDPQCAAFPLNVPLHPTQLYDVFLILVIIGILLIVKRYKKFDGQMFFIYLAVYAFGRSIIEIFRGDEERGFIIKNVFSHAQFVSLILIIVAVIFYIKLLRRSRKPKTIDPGKAF